MKAKLLFATFSLSMLGRLAFAFEGEAAMVPANLSHQPWDALCLPRSVMTLAAAKRPSMILRMARCGRCSGTVPTRY